MAAISPALLLGTGLELLNVHCWRVSGAIDCILVSSILMSIQIVTLLAS